MYAVEVIFKARVKDIKTSEILDPGILTKSAITGALEHIVEKWNKEVDKFPIGIENDGSELIFNYIFETDVKEEVEEFKERVYNIDIQGVQCESIFNVYPNARYISVTTDILDIDDIDGMKMSELSSIIKNKFSIFFEEYPTNISFCFISEGADSLDDVVNSTEYLLSVDFGVYNKTTKEIETISDELEEAIFVISAGSRRGIPIKKIVS